MLMFGIIIGVDAAGMLVLSGLGLLAVLFVAVHPSQAVRGGRATWPTGVVEAWVNEPNSADIDAGLFTVATTYTVDGAVLLLMIGRDPSSGFEQASVNRSVGSAFQSF